LDAFEAIFPRGEAFSEDSEGLEGGGGGGGGNGGGGDGAPYQTRRGSAEAMFYLAEEGLDWGKGCGGVRGGRGAGSSVRGRRESKGRLNKVYLIATVGYKREWCGGEKLERGGGGGGIRGGFGGILLGVISMGGGVAGKVDTFWSRGQGTPKGQGKFRRKSFLLKRILRVVERRWGMGRGVDGK